LQQQRDAVVAQRVVRIIDQHAIEEMIDRRLERREQLERVGVLALRGGREHRARSATSAPYSVRSGSSCRRCGSTLDLR